MHSISTAMWPGCMAHAPTQADALAEVNEAVQLWLDTANDFGDPNPQPKGRRPMLASAGPVA